MTAHQLAAFFCALPFLTLAAAWLIGLACLFQAPERKPIPVKSRRRPF